MMAYNRLQANTDYVSMLPVTIAAWYIQKPKEQILIGLPDSPQKLKANCNTAIESDLIRLDTVCLSQRAVTNFCEVSHALL